MYTITNKLDYNNIFIRVSNGILHDDKLQSYSIEILRRTISFFESMEEYEKCSVLKKIIEKRLNNEN